MHSILIIDDDSKIRNLYREYLSAADFHLFEAEDWGKASLFLTVSRSIDLILLDIRLPHVNGAALFDLIRLSNPDAKVLVASVYPIEDQRRAIPLADGYFDKSEGMEILLSRVRGTLAKERGVHAQNSHRR